MRCGASQLFCCSQRLTGALPPPLPPRVRHEAGEALGAIGTPACLQPLHDHQADPCLEVAQTCQLAVQRMEYFAAQQAAAGGEDAGAAAAGAANGGAAEGGEGPSPFLSVDPTPAAPASVPTPELARQLLDEEERIFQRYRAMFALRNRAGPAAVDALAACFATSRSALLKHEAAYVLGQMQDPRAVGMLRCAAARACAVEGAAGMLEAGGSGQGSRVHSHSISSDSCQKWQC